MSISCDIFLLFKDICPFDLGHLWNYRGAFVSCLRLLLKKWQRLPVRTQGKTDNSLKKIVLVSVSYMFIDKLSIRVAKSRLLPEAYGL